MSHRVAFPAHAPSDEIQSGRTLYRFAIPDTITVRIPLHNDTVTLSDNFQPFARTAAMAITRPLEMLSDGKYPQPDFIFQRQFTGAR